MEVKLVHMHFSYKHQCDRALNNFPCTCRLPRYAGTNVVYAAPEDRGGFEADMWSLGICLYAMLTAQFPCANPKLTPPSFEYVSNALSSSFSPLVIDLITNLLVVEPRCRLTIQQAMAHPWVDEFRMNEIERESKEEKPHARVSKVPTGKMTKRPGLCWACGATESVSWHRQGTMCNACRQRAERLRLNPTSVTREREQQMRDQLIAEGFSVKRSVKSKRSYSVHSPTGQYFDSVRLAYKYYSETSAI